MNWTNLRIAVAVILAGLASSAFAAGTTAAATSTDEIRSYQQMQKMPPMTVFKMIDTDKDGALSKDEFTTFMGKLFDNWDANHDGSISQEEWKAGTTKAKANVEKAGSPPAKPNQPRAE